MDGSIEGKTELKDVAKKFIDKLKKLDIAFDISSDTMRTPTMTGG
jgi:hypothetical protein